MHISVQAKKKMYNVYVISGSVLLSTASNTYHITLSLHKQKAATVPKQSHYHDIHQASHYHYYSTFLLSITINQAVLRLKGMHFIILNTVVYASYA